MIRAYINKKRITVSIVIIIVLVPILFFALDRTDIIAKITGKYEHNSQAEKSTGKTDVAGTLNEEDKKVLVVVDPGHGGNDPGTNYKDIYEKNITLNISKKLGALLESGGVRVLYTRTTDEAVELKERAHIANDANADLFISIHVNNMPESSKFRGTETLYGAPDYPNPSSIKCKRLAQIIQGELTKTLDTRDVGIFYKPEMAVLHRTNMPSVISEIAYLSNIYDRNNLESDKFRQKAAIALYNSVIQALTEMNCHKDDNGNWKKEGK